jgi:hypothetical protein
MTGHLTAQLNNIYFFPPIGQKYSKIIKISSITWDRVREMLCHDPEGRKEAN